MAATFMDMPDIEKRKVWIEEHPESAYAPGRVEEIRDDGTLIVVDDDGGSFMVQAAKAQTVDPACLTGVDDLLMLNDFNEAALLHNVRVRHAEDRIYTGVGSPILISVNPYAALPGLYSTARQREYRKAGAAAASGHELGIPPHLYSVADSAYRTMLSESVNQSIIISGESGAGKTEATKRILAFLADMQRGDGSQASSPEGKVHRRSIEQQVLDANPVLEAFGNAKTVRNDNSSRFGKFIEVEFDNSGKLLSAQISNYLLEKTRIVQQQPEERNYHIFYQLLAGVSDLAALNSRFQLRSAQDYEYTQACDTISGVDDTAEFNSMVECMSNLGFSAEDRVTIFAIVAAVLHLGNLSFITVPREGQDGVQISDESQVALISDLLGVEPEQVHSVMEHRTMEDRLTKKVIHMPQDEKSAMYTRHSMAKVAYARLFDWLVWRINQSISGQDKAKKDTRRIGLLDIYGFEVFEWNSFEQICINFANEKLQHHFNSHMFTLEQGLYSREGISWTHITFQDNRHIIDALEKRPNGLFCLIDSECVMPGATDMTLLNKIYNASTTTKSTVVYKPGRFQSVDFAVAHYAGEVTYSVETFLEKNTDKLHGDIVNLFKNSKLELLKTLFTDPKFAPDSSPKTSDKDRSRLRKSRSSVPEEKTSSQRQNVTVGMVFREQLDRLVEDLNKTNPRYIRCIKPNANKKPREFDSKDVLRQLRCAGMLECIRIRHAGYAVRRPYKEFFQRFRLLAPSLTATGTDPDYKQLCESLLSEVEQRLKKSDVHLPEKAWQLGQTRVFMKDEVERHCERLLVERSKRYVILVQTHWRRYSQRKRYSAMKSGARAAQAVLRTCVAMQQFAKARQMRKAILGLQAGLRSARQRALFMQARSAVISIQRFARGWWCRQRIGQIKGKMAQARVQRLREEEERKDALTAARKEAEEQKQAMEAMQREMQAQQAAAIAAAQQAALQQQQQQQQQQQHAAAQPVQIVPTADPEELQELQRHIDKLQNELRIAVDGKTEAERHSQALQGLAERLQEELRLAVDDKAEAEKQIQDLQQQLLARPVEAAPTGNIVQSIETFSRIGDSPGEAKVPVGTGSLGHSRRTIVEQEDIFRKIQEEFKEVMARSSDNDDSTVATSSEDNRQQQLEDELRRLRRENASLRTAKLSLEDEASEKQSEVDNLLLRVGSLTADLEAEKYKYDDEIGKLNSWLNESVTTAKKQAEDLADLSSRYQEKESLATSAQVKARKAEEDRAAMEDRLVNLQKSHGDQQQQLSVLQQERSNAADQLSATRRGEQAWIQERTQLRDELTRLTETANARAGELAVANRKIEELSTSRVPAEDLKTWRARAEMFERDYTQAMRKYQEMSSAVSHMTQASFEHGQNHTALQQQNYSLQQANQQKEHELKAAQLEKQELQKHLENFQVSCDYYQSKYKERGEELKALQNELALVQSKRHRAEIAAPEVRETSSVPSAMAPPARGIAPAPSLATTCLVGDLHQPVQACGSTSSSRAEIAPPTVIDLMQQGDRSSASSRGTAAGALAPPVALGSIQEDAWRALASQDLQCGGSSLSSSPSAQPKRRAGGYPPQPGAEVGLRPELLKMAEAEDQRHAHRPQQEALPLAGRESLLSQLNLNSRPGFTKKLGSLSEE